MKKYLLILTVILAGCNSGNERDTSTIVANNPDSVAPADHTSVDQPADTTSTVAAPQSNDRFRDVTLVRLSNDSANLRGRARIFEANLSYAVYEQGKLMYENFHTTSAGAPEWGEFDFNIKVPAPSTDTGTYVMVYESSAKDGSRVGILKFPLQ